MRWNDSAQNATGSPLVQPDIVCSLNRLDDQGALRVNRGFRVQFSSAIGVSGCREGCAWMGSGSQQVQRATNAPLIAPPQPLLKHLLNPAPYRPLQGRSALP